MKLQKFYIANKYGEGLHYIWGNLFWDTPDNIENLKNFTSFDTAEEAADFALERDIPGPVNIRKITYRVS